MHFAKTLQSFYEPAWKTLFWIVRIVLHNLSTTLSHVATFNVLGGIRRQICEKLSKIPLGSVLDDNSGSYKNIIVERVDSMETTLAHIIPEFTANIQLPLVMFVYLILVDWRMALANLIGRADCTAAHRVFLYGRYGQDDLDLRRSDGDP